MTAATLSSQAGPDLVKVRQAEESDLKLLARDITPAVGRTSRMELDEQAGDEHSLFIVIEDDEILGWGFVRWLGPRDPEAMRLFPNAPEIYRLEVRESHRSSGLGRSLIREMEAEAGGRGFRTVSLGVGDGTMAIPAGTLDGEPPVTIIGHMFTRELVP